jgi:hypothetical protein
LPKYDSEDKVKKELPEEQDEDKRLSADKASKVSN